MTDRRFLFPVALADDDLVGRFMVTGFPTKLLLSPAGGVMVVPFGSDWELIARRYLLGEHAGSPRPR